jgi:hypothetical protein
MLDRLDAMQVSPMPAQPLPLLPALLAHPDVQDGLRAGVRAFQEGMFEEDHEKVWSEQDIVQFVNHELSCKMYRRERMIEQALGGPPLSYLHHLGFVLGYLDRMLAATHVCNDQPEERVKPIAS